ncbi:unnamed protein product [Arctogadus glacialis]
MGVRAADGLHPGVSELRTGCGRATDELPPGVSGLQTGNRRAADGLRTGCGRAAPRCVRATDRLQTGCRVLAAVGEGQRHRREFGGVNLVLISAKTLVEPVRYLDIPLLPEDPDDQDHWTGGPLITHLTPDHSEYN